MKHPLVVKPIYYIRNVWVIYSHYFFSHQIHIPYSELQKKEIGDPINDNDLKKRTLGELVLFKSLGLFKQSSYNNFTEKCRFVVLHSVRLLRMTGSENDSEKSNHISLRNINYGQQ